MLIEKMHNLGLDNSLCRWTLYFLSNRPQTVRMGNHSSSTLALNTGTPQGCVLNPLLYSIFTHNCSPIHPTNIIVKFADDTTIVGLISNNKAAYREEVKHLTNWCSHNNLNLNQTKEIIVDFRKSKHTEHTALSIHRKEVERVGNTYHTRWGRPNRDSTSCGNSNTLTSPAHQFLLFCHGEYPYLLLCCMVLQHSREP